MPFDLRQFFLTNKRILIWTAFFGLLYLIRGLFGLVFLTFILGFIFNNIIKRLTNKFKAPRRLWTILIYLVFVVLAVIYFSSIGPRLGSESTVFIKSLPAIIDQMHLFLDSLAEKQPHFAPILARAKEAFSLQSLVGMDGQTIVNLAVASFNKITHYFSYLLLGTLFSFLILFDFPNLREKTLALRQSRLKEVFEETAGSVVQFAYVVGEAFQAQLVIAGANTILTALGLWALGIHPISLLCTIVFFAGLIPVLGVFISSAPILLLAFNTGDMNLVGGAFIMIILVHMFEAYILNPNIFSVVFKMNPVLTLIILYIGNGLFGWWGVLLGIPVSVYIYRYVILGEKPLILEHLDDKAEESCDTREKKGVKSK